MPIRTFGAGDDAIQVAIYNEAAAGLPKLKPATLDEVRRRRLAPDYDPTTHFVAEVGGQPVGYAAFHANGRVSYPWCRKGHEDQAEPLFQHVLDTMRARGLRRAFAAYRADWPQQADFFRRHDFQQTREMVSYLLDLVEMPTPSAHQSSAIGPMKSSDIPAVLAMGADVLRAHTVEELERHLLHNPYFPPESALVLRSRAGGTPLAAAVVVVNDAYANPRQTDADMPCFRLGAFGTEGMHAKRINGLFSFLAADTHDTQLLALELLGYAAFRLQETDVATLAAQVPSDVNRLVRFYKQYFRRQGAFPVFEREL